MTFSVDQRIEESSLLLFEGPLSQFYIKNDARFPWVILVPRIENLREIHQLTTIQQNLLMSEIVEVSRIVEQYFKPDKLNVGALGNIVNQLHIHIIARFMHDQLWPQSIWQEAASDGYKPYQLDELTELTLNLRQQFQASLILNKTD